MRKAGDKKNVYLYRKGSGTGPSYGGRYFYSGGSAAEESEKTPDGSSADLPDSVPTDLPDSTSSNLLDAASTDLPGSASTDSPDSA